MVRLRLRLRRLSRACPLESVGCPAGRTPERIAEDEYVTAADLHDERPVQPLQGHRAVDVEEVGGEHPRWLGTQELPPRRVAAPLRRRENLQRLEDPADRGRADLEAELEQFALDPLVSPAVVLGGEPRDERGDLGADRRPSCPIRVGPLAVTRQRCQRRTKPGVTRRCARTVAGKSRISAARAARSAQSSRGRGWVRRSTATSCRSTISASLEADDRLSMTYAFLSGVLGVAEEGGRRVPGPALSKAAVGPTGAVARSLAGRRWPGRRRQGATVTPWCAAAAYAGRPG
jgi:hypothetical protein